MTCCSINSRTPKRVAAIIVEPVIGEGGYIVPSPTFLPRLREVSSRLGILLIVDEVQTGYGRTGRFFGLDHSGIDPDIVVVAKGIASGLPLSGIIARTDLMDAWKPGVHGGTYGGNVVSCAAAVATLDVIQGRGSIVENARIRGAEFLSGLEAIGQRHDIVGDVRGLGLMLALELIEPGAGDGRKPNPEATKRVQSEALDRASHRPHGRELWQRRPHIPPLVTTNAEISHALEILDASLEAAAH